MLIIGSGPAASTAADSSARGELQPLVIEGTQPAGHPSIAAASDSPYERRILRLAFPAPDIQRDILAGRQPAHLNLEHLMKREIPLSWDRQRQALGWSRRSAASLLWRKKTLL